MIKQNEVNVVMNDSVVIGNCQHSSLCDANSKPLCGKQGGSIAIFAEEKKISANLYLHNVKMYNLSSEVGGAILGRQETGTMMKVTLKNVIFGGNTASVLPSGSDVAVFQTSGQLSVDVRNVSKNAQMISFPKKMKLNLYASSKEDALTSICPNCTMFGVVQSWNVFDQLYEPITEYCTIDGVCSNVQIQLQCSTAYSNDSCPRDIQALTSGFSFGNGNATFVARPGMIGQYVNITLACQTNQRGGLCSLDSNLTSSNIRQVPFVNCPRDLNRKVYPNSNDLNWFWCESPLLPNFDLTKKMDKRPAAVALLTFVALCIMLVFLLGWFHEMNILRCGTSFYFEAFGYIYRLQKKKKNIILFFPVTAICMCVGLQIDINLCQAFWQAYVYLAWTGHKNESNVWLRFALTSTIFLVLPWLMNVGITIAINSRLLNIIPKNKFTQASYASKRVIIGMLVVFSGDFYSAVDLMNCRLFGLPLFHLGMTQYELRRFSQFRLFTCIFQNLPQMILQLAALRYTQKNTVTDIDGSVYLAFCMSLLSITATVLGYCLQRNEMYRLETFELVIKLHYSSSVNPSVKEIAGKTIRENRGRYYTIIQPLLQHCKDLTSNQVSVGSVDITGDTICIYGNIVRLTSNIPTKLDTANGETVADGKYTYEGKEEKICQSVLLRGFGLEKQLKTYLQSNQPKVTLKGSYFKIFSNEPQVPRPPNTNSVMSRSGDGDIEIGGRRD
ncbi:hypothetical protein RFI_23388 [Reticulomyxa filosa]|uniref:Uncharacterized protein n=1 Tax=Reticulomyxa filosa TaxID=46433 RepID=X6MIZ6_RETFI|nr:hypothetical protein RFI_23388 [Reticulomyxa filosa]|eukprot:ETO13978.1 hypothetical protein RFI_23388 [Reticulomyxa filosa]